MIKKIKYRDQEFSYPIFDYLYPYLIKLVWGKKLVSDHEGVLIISDKFANDLLEVLRKLMLEILDEFYVQPTEEEKTEYRGRFETIQIEERSYFLNIATVGHNRVVFQIYSLLIWIKEHQINC